MLEEQHVLESERLLQLESIFALGISITGLQSSASLIMDSHMALLTHAVQVFLPLFLSLGTSLFIYLILPYFTPCLLTDALLCICSHIVLL